MNLEFVCDGYRHLVCLPYSVANLHAMAKVLGISKNWFHHNHYDIPKKRVSEIVARCRCVPSREIVRIIYSSTTDMKNDKKTPPAESKSLPVENTSVPPAPNEYAQSFIQHPIRVDLEVMARLAWDTYSKAVGGVAFNGDKLPTWEAMVADEKKQKLVDAWRATATGLAVYVLDEVDAQAPKLAAPTVVTPDTVGTATASAGFPARHRHLGNPTRCCGSRVLTLIKNVYKCPCGGHTEPIA